MILLMGLPGSGKGTQGKMLADEKGLHLISTGELLRMYITGERRQRMLEGEFLDDQEMIELLQKVLDGFTDSKDIVLDGFPRTTVQAQWLLEQQAAGKLSIDHIVYLKASHEAVKSRLMARGRLDDKEDVIERRFHDYEGLTQPVIDWFKEQGMPVHEIDGEGTAAEVHEDVRRVLNLPE